jgi:hypothetical protein
MQLPGGFSPPPEAASTNHNQGRPSPHANGLFLYELSNEGFNLVNSFPNSHQAGEFLGVTFHCKCNRMKRGSIWLFSTVFLTVYPSGLNRGLYEPRG